MLTTCALPIVQLEEISDDAIVSIDRLDIMETPRSRRLDSSDDVGDSKNDVWPNSGVSR